MTLVVFSASVSLLLLASSLSGTRCSAISDSGELRAWHFELCRARSGVHSSQVAGVCAAIVSFARPLCLDGVTNWERPFITRGRAVSLVVVLIQSQVYCLPLTYHLIVRILICVGQMLGVSIQGLVFCGLKLPLISYAVPLMFDDMVSSS